MSAIPLQALRQSVREGKCAVVVGSGVSQFCTNNAAAASWKGLLRSGIDYCQNWRPVNEAQLKRHRDAIETGSTDEMLEAANFISQTLGQHSTNSRSFGEWIEGSIGQLEKEVRDERPLQELHKIQKLGNILLTTNYDHLLERETKLEPVSWSDAVRYIRACYKNDGILHLHGHYKAPESVILDLRGYQKVLESKEQEHVFKSIPVHKDLIFVGCGPGGLQDPHFEAIFEWMRYHFPSMASNAYILVKDDKIEHGKVVKKWDRLNVYEISYGSTYEGLVSLLSELRSPDFVYHLVPANEWKAAEPFKFYVPQSLATDGFIHTSRADQLEETIQRKTYDPATTLILKIDLSKIGNYQVIEEKGKNGEFPHIYGPLAIKAVEAAVKIADKDYLKNQQ